MEDLLHQRRRGQFIINWETCRRMVMTIIWDLITIWIVAYHTFYLFFSFCLRNKFDWGRILFYYSDLPRLRKGAMLILKIFSPILCIMYTYKPSSWIILSIKKPFKARWVVLKIQADNGKQFFFILLKLWTRISEQRGLKLKPDYKNKEPRHVAENPWN
jgi:hypothetical protein